MLADATAARYRDSAFGSSRSTSATAATICCWNLAAIVFLQRIVVPLGGDNACLACCPSPDCP
jgi:hypothetical protein